MARNRAPAPFVRDGVHRRVGVLLALAAAIDPDVLGAAGSGGLLFLVGSDGVLASPDHDATRAARLVGGSPHLEDLERAAADP